MEEKLRLMSLRENESNEMVRQRDYNKVEMEEKVQISRTREKMNESMMQRNIMIEDHLKAVNSFFKNEISDIRIGMESTTVGLQKDTVKNGVKDSTTEELKENVCLNTEEKMRMKIENAKGIEDLQLSEKKAEEFSYTFQICSFADIS